MRPSSYTLALVGLALPGGLLAACSNLALEPAAGDAARQPTIVVPNDAGVSLDTGTDTAPLRTNVRLALFAPSHFGVDICLRGATAQAFSGPLLYSQLPTLPDGGSPDAGNDAGRPPRDAGRDGGPTRDGAAADVTLLGDARAHDATVDAPSHADATPAADARPSDAMADGMGDAMTVGDGGNVSGGVLPGQVSAYLPVTGAGTFDVAVVHGGEGSCAAPIEIQRVTLDAGKFSTLMVIALPPVSDAGADAAAIGPALAVLTDEPDVIAAAARVRFVNVTTPDSDAGTSALSVAAVTLMGAPTPLAAAVPRDHAAWPNSMAPAVDPLGYWAGPQLPNPLQLRVSPAIDAGVAAWTSASQSLDVSQGSNHTGFILGAAPALSVLWCNDEESGSVLTSCVLVPGT